MIVNLLIVTLLCARQVQVAGDTGAPFVSINNNIVVIIIWSL